VLGLVLRQRDDLARRVRIGRIEACIHTGIIRPCS
jgi:hypothetical protein